MGKKTDETTTFAAVKLEVLQPFTVNWTTFLPGEKLTPDEYQAKTFPGSMEGRIENGFLRFTVE